MAATTQNLAAFQAAWDAAMAVYDVAHGTNTTALILGSFDMNSIIHAPAGLWNVQGAAVPTIVPNSNLQVVWTDGTDEIMISYDELLVAARVETVLDGFFDASFKMWRILTHVAAELVTAGATVTTIGAGPWTWANYTAFITALEGRYTPADEYGLELPGMMG